MESYRTNYTMSCFASLEHRKDTIVNRINELIETMDVPEQRKTDFNWLIRNLGIRNRENENYKELIFLIKLAIRT